MISENAWPVHKHQDLTRVPFARCTAQCRSWIARPARKAVNTPPQTRQRRAMSPHIGSLDLPNAGCA